MTQLLEATIPQNVCGARNLLENAWQGMLQSFEGCPQSLPEGCQKHRAIAERKGEEDPKPEDLHDRVRFRQYLSWSKMPSSIS